MTTATARNFIVASILVCTSAFAWGPTGHRAAARIAEKHLSAKAASKVADLVGPESLPEVSTWADEIRSDPAWSKASPWHYVNIDDGETYASSRKNPGGDIITELRRCEAVLRDTATSREEKAVALKFLVHLVADLHQPVHAGRLSDRGGNDIRVTWHGQSANLHEVWDSLLIDSEKLAFSELAAFADHATPRQVAVWQKSGCLDWLDESLSLRAQAYDIGGGKLSYAYSDQSFPLVKMRLAQAGVRLAGLLNSIFE